MQHLYVDSLGFISASRNGGSGRRGSGFAGGRIFGHHLLVERSQILDPLAAFPPLIHRHDTALAPLDESTNVSLAAYSHSPNL